MKIHIAVLSFIAILFFSSCQQEPDVVLPSPAGDSTVLITPMLRIVELDPDFPGDSIIRIIKRVGYNGEKVIIMAEVFSEDPLDTVLTTFSYNAQNRLVAIKAAPASDPGQVWARHQFIWNGSRLSRLTVDTAGVFAESFDFSYTPEGVNTIITSVKTPSDDMVTPDHISRVKHKVTVNPQLVPVSEQWIQYFYSAFGNSDPGLPQMAHDTADFFYTYSGNDLSLGTLYNVGYDTNVSIIPYTNIYRDTQTLDYTRSTGSTNIADSLKSIYGPEVFMLMNFDLLYFYYTSWVIGDGDNKKFYFNRPLVSLYNSRRVWRNGVFDAGESQTNYLLNKAENTFDANGRLVTSIIYQDHSETVVSYTIKIYYD